VALEKGLVEGYILDGYQALGALELDDSVNQQKRVAVGKEAQDLLDVECHSWLQRARWRGRFALLWIITKGPRRSLSSCLADARAGLAFFTLA
jgi:hypothetical protein